jgi:hypothetical protein
VYYFVIETSVLGCVCAGVNVECYTSAITCELEKEIWFVMRECIVSCGGRRGKY